MMPSASPTTAPIFRVQRASERATFDHDWLHTSHSFSFAGYYDPQNVNWGALRVLNDDRVLAGMGFGAHPHRDMEILTYVLEGELEHRDSLGSHGVVGPGGVQFLSAGTGVKHSEFNHSKTAPLHFLQMWVMPGRLGGEPTYGQVDFDIEQRRNTWLTVASGREGVAAPVALTQDASFHVARLEDGTVTHEFDANRLGFAFLAEGDAVARGFDAMGASVGDERTLASGDAIRIAGIARLELRGTGEAVLWDVPPID